VKRKKMNTKKRNLRDDERAVSPVIGVILMVAITVVMAAVIGAFVYGYGGSMTQTKDVACVARHVGGTIYVTYMGGPDQGLVAAAGLTATIGGTDFVSNFGGIAVGTTAKDSTGTGTDNHIIVVATFTDGTDQVVLDTYC
jgi:flagellin-like protein